jgi:hypothetical protein
MQELTTKMIQSNLMYYLSKHTPLTEQQVKEQFEEWLMSFVANIIEVRENQIIKELEANHHIWRERVVLVALKALIKGETNE